MEAIAEFDWSTEDLVPRYTPKTVTLSGKGKWPAVRVEFFPIGQHPEECYIRADMGVLKLSTAVGDRLYGCKHAYINSELRMVVIGTFRSDEVRTKWEVVPEKLR